MFNWEAGKGSFPAAMSVSTNEKDEFVIKMRPAKSSLSSQVVMSRTDFALFRAWAADLVLPAVKAPKKPAAKK